jgi:hypothetical protein
MVFFLAGFTQTAVDPQFLCGLFRGGIANYYGSAIQVGCRQLLWFDPSISGNDFSGNYLVPFLKNSFFS